MAEPGSAVMSPSQALFNAVLEPHRSLSPQAFRLLMIAVTLAFLALGAAFTAIGAWPVLPFCGVEILLIYWAFRVNFRDGRLYETIMLTDQALTVSRVRPTGKADNWRFAPPHWLRIEVNTLPDGTNRLRLTSHGRSLQIGEFLTSDERSELATALRQAIRRLHPLQ